MSKLVSTENGFLLFDACNSCGSSGYRLHAIVLHNVLGAVCQGCWTNLNSLINLADDNPSKAKAFWN